MSDDLVSDLKINGNTIVCKYSHRRFLDGQYVLSDRVCTVGIKRKAVSFIETTRAYDAKAPDHASVSHISALINIGNGNATTYILIMSNDHAQMLMSWFTGN